MGQLKINWKTVAITAVVVFILIRGFDIDKLFGTDRD